MVKPEKAFKKYTAALFKGKNTQKNELISLDRVHEAIPE